ncbi:MAG: hypothetical protein WBE07_08835, partial [Psychrobacter sp.]
EAAARFLRKMQDKMDHERTEAKAKSALQPSSSTQEKVADSVRENTPSAASTPTTDLRTDVIDTPRVDTNDIYNSDDVLPDSGLNDDLNK